ncbi:DUF1145 domain-containing protein [Pseudomonas sp. Bout1]|uniref:DUF1145 domain-containing protein n=1 Tax=Pseudomonas sp. Bout1 TaxID=3048600 RepID=UPI002AB58E58|nr:DUF1145 domain-containing protein [Pseudomonas sp. Bout1]MDY7531402.1 DUF1145 domain-containing protein [Pseudomonas sp. Bout1]MEB0188986.1 DUF1145 domain-containing protein [Pseudomonas sp. Bout1]
MKVFWGLGKLLTLLFWVLVVVNLFTPLINPFHLLVSLAGSLLLLTHILELLLFNGSVKNRAHPWRDRLQILLVGMFHVQSFSAPAPTNDVTKEANHA